MKRILMILLVLLLFSPNFVFSDIATFRIGYFFPRANGELWVTEFENMSFTKTQIAGSIFGFSYEYFITNQVGIQFNIEGYSKQKNGFYVGFVSRQYGTDIWAYPDTYIGDNVPAHLFSVSITPVQLSIKISPMGRKQSIIPFIGGGVGLYISSVRLQGDIIIFSEEYIDEGEEGMPIVYPVKYRDIRDDNRLAVGFHALGGIMAPIGNRISLEGEVKYNFAKVTMNNFIGFDKFDLSGLQLSLGFNYWF